MLFLAFQKFDGSNFVEVLTIFCLGTLAFITAIAVHEANHALVATVLGDDTPRRYGRLSLNPMRHVDKTGLVVFMLAAVGWGWTPVNPQNLRPNPRTGNAIVASAGPLANLGLALLFSLPLWADPKPPEIIRQFLSFAVWLNLLLFVLNFIPLPPLDGFTVLVGLLPQNLAAAAKRLEPYGLGILFAVFFLLPFAFNINPLFAIFEPVCRAFGFPIRC